MLAAALAAVGLLTSLFVVWLRVTNPTTVALSYLLVVLIVATVGTRRVAIAASLMAFFCFNYFFLPPVGAWTIADPGNWVALFTLLAVSIVASREEIFSAYRHAQPLILEIKTDRKSVV